MKDKVNQKNALVEIINKALKERNWIAAKLSKESGVNQPTISRFLGGCINIKVENIYRILKTLDLFSCDQKVAKTSETSYNSEQVKILFGIIEDLRKEIKEFKKDWNGKERRVSEI